MTSFVPQISVSAVNLKGCWDSVRHWWVLQPIGYVPKISVPAVNLKGYSDVQLWVGICSAGLWGVGALEGGVTGDPTRGEALLMSYWQGGATGDPKRDHEQNREQKLPLGHQ